MLVRPCQKAVRAGKMNIFGLVCPRGQTCQLSPFSSHVNKGCILETDQKYGLIAWARKGPKSKDKCPFLVHILLQVRAFMTRAHAIVHGSS